MNIRLSPITPDNWQTCIKLKPHEHQQAFIAPNVYSLAKARVFPEYVPLAIYAGETMVGFLMYRFTPDDNIPWLCCFMIDQAHQGKGYGRAALQEAIMLIEAQSEHDTIMACNHPTNSVAARLYSELGFVPTGETRDDQTVLRLRLQ
jgi:diamine N-acetyltransferase